MPLTPRYPLGPRRTGQPAATDLLARREAGVASPYPPVADIGVGKRQIGGIDCVVACRAGAPAGDVVWFHGGGYRQGTPDRMTGFLSLLAEGTGCRVIAPAYALAPEQPYPAALHDAAAVIEAVAGVADPDRPLFLCGDSAGGGLAAACCLAFGTQLGRLVGTVLLSPWLDLRLSAESFERCATTDRLFSLESATAAAASYLQGLSASTPLASPLAADTLDGFPPALVIAGSAEVLVRDSLDLTVRLATEHKGVELLVVPRMQHVSPTLFPDLPSSAYSLAAITRFVLARIAGYGAVADPSV